MPHKVQSKTALIKQLESLQKATAARLDGDDVESLVHELQVHQIELEVQNLELREAQHALEEARDRYADLYDFAPVAYVTLDRNGIIQDLNMTAAGMLGRERAHLLGMPFAVWLAPQDKASFFAHVKRVFQSAPRAASELRIKNATGDLIWVHLESAFAESAKGEPGACRTAVFDITDRRRAEEALQEVRDGLEERVERRTAELSEANLRLTREIAERQRAKEERIRLMKEMDAESARLNAVLRQMPAGVVIAEAPTGRLISGNEQVEKILRQPFFACKDMAGWKAYTGFHADGRPYGPEEWPLARSLLNGEVVNGEEIEILRGDGSRCVIQVGSTPIRDAEGRITAGVAVFSDITERKRAEKEALEHRTQLAHVARLSTIGEMASGIAHEINQPLAAIVLFTQSCLRMVESGTADPPELRRVMQQVAKQGLRAGEIIRRVMQFTRGKTGKRGLADLNELVREMALFVQSEAQEHGITIQLDLAEDLPGVRVDRIQVEQVILNLLRNAMEALEMVTDGPHVLSVETTGRGAGVVELAVVDTGPGLLRETHDRLFDPFFTTKPDGLGLGLSISRSIVTAHGGRLWADPSRAHGASFHVTLPVAREGRDEG